MKKTGMAVKWGMAVAAVLMAGSAWAQGPGGEPGPGFGEHRPPFERAMGAPGEHGRWWNNPKVIERLKLTDAQRKSMDDTLQQHRESLVDLRAALEKAELVLEPLMRQDQPNEGQVLAQIDKVAQARAELEKANARFLLAIRRKLTPEQWKQMEADRANRPRPDWKDGRGPGQGGGRRGLPFAPPADGQPPLPPGGPQGKVDDAPGADSPVPDPDPAGNKQ